MKKLGKHLANSLGQQAILQGPDRVTYPDTYPVAFIGDPDRTA